MNQVLLQKCLSRIEDSSEVLWRQLIVTKFGVSRNGWDCHGATYKHSAIWKGIISFSVNENFLQNVRYRVLSGERILFWLDICAGDNFLATRFPNLFSCA